MKSAKIGLLLPFMVFSLALSVHAYKVEKGDSLYKIAKKHGTTAAALARLNGMEEDSVLSVGQEIKVPDSVSSRGRAVNRSGSAALSSVYAVEKGDTISGIAKKTGVSIAALLKANGFDEKSVIKEGQLINLPKGVEYTKPAVKFASKPAAPGRTDMAGLALSLVGSRYVSGGTSRGGFDCSGLVSFVYSNFGIKLPRTSREQAAWGKAVEKANLQKGDILLFSIHRSGVDHVGIYVGGGEFVHAANTKKGVAKDKLSSGFYVKHYVGARRAN